MYDGHKEVVVVIPIVVLVVVPGEPVGATPTRLVVAISEAVELAAVRVLTVPVVVVVVVNRELVEAARVEIVVVD